MATFKYQGRNASGGQVKGIIESIDTNAAVTLLVKQQIIITQLEETKDSGKKIQDMSDINILDLLGVDALQMSDLINFCRQMYALLRSGVPILKATKGLATSSSGKKLRQALSHVVELLEGGYSLSAAFNKYPQVFNPLFVSIIHVGENTGQLDNSFLKLSTYFEREEQTAKRVKTAMRYPSFVLGFLGLAMVVLNIFVIPTFNNIFNKLGDDLPLTTQLLINSSKLFVEYGPYTLVVFLSLIFGVHSYLQTKKGRYTWDKAKLKLPIIGTILERTILARFTYSLATVLEAGVSMTSALSLVAEAVNNSYIRERILTMRLDVETGVSLFQSASNSQIFTPLVLQMVAVGDESGRVAELLQDVGDYYEREVDYDLATLTAKMEPLLIIIVAGMVLVMALGIFEPMWNLNDAMSYQ